MSYTTTKEIRSQTKVGKGIYIFDLFFLLAFMGVHLFLAQIVNGTLTIFFLFGGFCIGLFLTSQSHFNRKRRNYESLIIFIRKDMDVYRPI